VFHGEPVPIEFPPVGAAYHFIVPDDAVALNVTEHGAPTHVPGVVPVMIGGIDFTVTVLVAVPVHPFVVPVTLYSVVEPGVTIFGFPDPNPLSHEYVEAPLAVKVAEDPGQIVGVVGSDVIETLGMSFIVARTDVLPAVVQPLAVASQ